MNPVDLYQVRQEPIESEMLDAMVEYMMSGQEGTSR